MMGIVELFTKLKKRYYNTGYEGASKRKRLKNWNPSRGSANSTIFGSIYDLRSRSRDLVRNNPLASKAVSTLTTNIVGHGVKVKFVGTGAKSVQDVWNKWAKSTYCDFDGMMCFYSLQEHVMRSVIESGECLVRKRINTSKEFPLEYQVMEGDFFAPIFNRLSGANHNIVQGIEIDQDGRVVNYHLYKTHPGEAYIKSYESFNGTINNFDVQVFSPKEIYHIYNKTRPGQLRGVPWAAPAIVRFKDTDDFLDATIMKQKVAACFAGFVTDLSADLVGEENINSSDIELAERLEPATIEELPPGKDIKFTDPPNTENFKEFNAVMDRNIANGMNLSYEALTGDLSGVNFSSARMGWLEMARHVDSVRRKVLIDGFLGKVVSDFIEVYRLKSGRSLATIDYEVIHPKREMIDPTKETKALIDAVRGGLLSLDEAITTLGRNPEKVFEQIAIDNEKIDMLGLKLDSDGRVEANAAAESSLSNEGSEGGPQQSP